MSSAKQVGEVMSSVEKDGEVDEVEPGSVVTCELKQGEGSICSSHLRVSVCSINMETDLTSHQHFPLNTAAHPERKPKC
ncbi:uncharacterized [Tachysurus ichikawai]